VWDTVAAYGLPIDELTLAVDKFIWPLSMPDRDLSDQVDRAMHALSLDDERNTFHPQLWNEAAPKNGKAPNAGRPGGTIEDERLSQVWFAGVHANLGGGYPDDTLSFVPLDWIMRGAERAGLRFDKAVWGEYRRQADENGVIYDSRKGLAGYYRYNPRRIEHLTNTSTVQIPAPKIHESVFRRIAIGHDGYAPIVIPPNFHVAKVSNPGTPSAVVPGQQGLGLSAQDLVDYTRFREHAWNLVWWRRLTYFATLAATLVLAAAPLIQPPLAKGACMTGFCFLSEWVALLAFVLPSFATVWTDTLASHPEWLLLLGAIGGGLWLGSALDVWIRNAMRAVWYTLPITRPRPPVPASSGFTKPREPGLINGALQTVRTPAGTARASGFSRDGCSPSSFLVSWQRQPTQWSAESCSRLQTQMAKSASGPRTRARCRLCRSAGRPFRPRAPASRPASSWKKAGRTGSG
jgi:hypothetical protein